MGKQVVIIGAGAGRRLRGRRGEAAGPVAFEIAMIEQRSQVSVAA